MENTKVWVAKVRQFQRTTSLELSDGTSETFFRGSEQVRVQTNPPTVSRILCSKKSIEYDPTLDPENPIVFHRTFGSFLTQFLWKDYDKFNDRIEIKFEVKK